MRWRRALPSILILTALLASCSTIPRVEVTAYTRAYAEVLSVTNAVLDIVSPYERIVIRNMAVAEIAISSSGRGRLALNAISVPEAYAQFREDPSLIAPRSGPSLPSREDPSLTAPRSAPSLPSREDPSLAAPRSSPPLTPSLSVPEDPSLKAPRSTPSLPRRARTSISAGPCRTLVAGDDPFCYETRDGYADIGDPPLVAAHRNLANVVLRFNMLLIAYAEGVSGRLLQQELAELSASVGELGRTPSVAGIGGAAFATGFGALVAGLAPITKFAGGYIDRAELRRFLLQNVDLVDEAIGAMARNSVELYANVAVGTNFFIRATRSPAEIENLRLRRQEIRRLIANWTVLLDNTRRMLGELKLAVAASDGLETRLRNLEGTVQTRIDTSAVKKQIATLGAPTLPR